MAEQATTMILVNDSDRIRQFAIPKKMDGGTVEHDMLRLNPGANVVSVEKYKALKASIETVDSIMPMEKPISALSVHEAIAIAERTISVPLLEGFLAIEKRGKVCAVIEKQIRECKMTAKAAKA